MTEKPLTERDWDTLNELVGAYDQAAKFYPNDLDHFGVRPLDFGGGNGSHQGATATKLAKRGLVEARKRGAKSWEFRPSSRGRGSKVYRPTAAGREALAQWLKGGSNGRA